MFLKLGNKFIFVILIFIPYISSDRIKCIPELTQNDCSKDEVLVDNAGILGVCPGCVGGLGKTKICDDAPCMPGLICKKKPSSAKNKTCNVDENNGCFWIKHISEKIKLIPTCDPRNNFAAVQCKGDHVTGRCFCSTDDGKKLFGWDWWRDIARNKMTCACSRWRHKLEEDGHLGVYLHCATNGNYEELQCTTKYCWCAIPETGGIVPGTRIVPHKWWTHLPCYDLSKHGNVYQRQCESTNFIASMLIEKYRNHGTYKVTLRNVVCDFDGSYGDHVVQNGLIFCVWRDGTKIDPYSNTVSEAKKIDCTCARDKLTYQSFGIEFTSSCSASGGYRKVQQQGEKFYCADKDGYAASELLDWASDEECDQYYWDAEEDEED